MFDRLLNTLKRIRGMDDANNQSDESSQEKEPATEQVTEEGKETVDAASTENVAETAETENQAVDDAGNTGSVPISSGTIDDCTCNTNDQMPGSWHAIFCPNYRAEETELVQHPNVEQVSETDFVIKEPTDENKA